MSNLTVRKASGKVARAAKKPAHGYHVLAKGKQVKKPSHSTSAKPAPERKKKEYTFKDHLLCMPEIPEEYLVRQRDLPREIEL
jgi:hypothetical protein